MRIMLINGSPRGKNGNSQYLLDEVEKELQHRHELAELDLNKKDFPSEALTAIQAQDALVFAFPLYVDGIPSHLLRCLMRLESLLKPQAQRLPIHVYAIVNCGFYEGGQTRLALEMMAHWCDQSRLIWGQGLGVGGGEMLGQIKTVPLGRGPKKNLGKALSTLIHSIVNGQNGQNLFVSPAFPRWLFLLAANFSWNHKARANGLKKKALHQNSDHS